MLLENKVAIITGGSRGIGKAVADGFIAQGAKVYAFDVIEPEVETNDSYKFIKVDVTNPENVDEAVKTVIEEAGSLDILVNNAGITRDTLMMRMKIEDWEKVLDINLKGAFICSKAVLRQMMKQRNGRIINMGSIVGSTGNAGQVNYSSSKAGMIGMTKSMAKELGSRNILVNLIAPGFVITDMTDKLTDEQKAAWEENIPLKRGAQPKEIADTAVYFASDLSGYVTGQVLHVDGGLAS